MIFSRALRAFTLYSAEALDRFHESGSVWTRGETCALGPNSPSRCFAGVDLRDPFPPHDHAKRAENPPHPGDTSSPGAFVRPGRERLVDVATRTAC